MPTRPHILHYSKRPMISKIPGSSLLLGGDNIRTSESYHDDDDTISHMISFCTCLSSRHFQSLAETNCGATFFDRDLYQSIHCQPASKLSPKPKHGGYKEIFMKPYWIVYAIDKDVLVESVIDCAEHLLFSDNGMWEKSILLGDDLGSSDRCRNIKAKAGVKAFLKENTHILYENNILVPTDLMANGETDASAWSIKIKFLESISRTNALQMVKDALFVDGIWYTERSNQTKHKTYLLTFKYIWSILQQANPSDLYISGATIEDNRHATSKPWTKYVIVYRCSDDVTVQIRLFSNEDCEI